MGTKDESESVEYRLGYARGVAAGKAEANKWWAERWFRFAKAWNSDEQAEMAKEMIKKAEEVLGE